ncbi:SafA/ExsA family spore coat assembly protein [Anoxybacillus sp. J5B_2022]|uniref:SafA/ExsA family spore coat assembly protein n=1 Tax=Anoxybacillus sp. J5B_2022 TaxID=3003246 RepID=UPI0022855863|nr:SafA/ExsA family spore coat assembly protein [Anoxybacillus sp. J5B_2022]MCZ0756767.1 SafA/ExsA family spore coat assembly protein [Anoxybacillus sp. J5B_2022]
MKIHIVQKGDTLWKIAQKYGVDFEQLKKINGHLSDPNLIMPGMKIKIPTAGVQVKKEMQKKETVIHMHPKKEEPMEHPYAEAKPFVSFNIEAELAPNVNVNPPAKETPKASNINENPPAKEEPKTSNMNVNPPAKEAPKAPNVNQPLPEPPKAPVAEKPKEPPKAPAAEVPKAAINESANANAEKTSPLPYTIPPVSPKPNAHFMNMPGMPPLPPKPANILPHMMKPDVEDIESPEKAAHHDTPPELPAVPYVPMWPQQQPWGYAPVNQPNQPNQPNQASQPNVALSQDPCVPVTPVMPGDGFYYPPMPFTGYPVAPPMPLQAESSPHLFPGIHESSESHEWIPSVPLTTSEQPPATAPPSTGWYSAPPMPPSYGWTQQVYPQPYMPTAPAYYPQPYQAAPQPPSFPAPQQAGTPAPAYPFAQTPMQPYYAPMQPSAFPPSPQQLFMMPQYGESSERDE